MIIRVIVVNSLFVCTYRIISYIISYSIYYHTTCILWVNRYLILDSKGLRVECGGGVVVQLWQPVGRPWLWYQPQVWPVNQLQTWAEWQGPPIGPLRRSIAAHATAMLEGDIYPLLGVLTKENSEMLKRCITEPIGRFGYVLNPSYFVFFRGLFVHSRELLKRSYKGMLKLAFHLMVPLSYWSELLSLSVKIVSILVTCSGHCFEFRFNARMHSLQVLIIAFTGL